MTDQTGAPIVVLMTAGSREEAARLAEVLVAARHAACVQILPEVASIYWWKGTVQRSPEHLLIAKTTQDKFAELANTVLALHSYETPEIIALPVTAASAPYLEWLTATIGSAQLKQTVAEPSEKAMNASAEAGA